jgi:radical SAM protein with 4Fe4S-binding SPASM domain
MCWFYGEAGIGNRYKDSELSTKNLYNLINQMTHYMPKLYLGGSEPFIREDFLQILQYIKNKNFKVTFATNGTLLDTAILKILVEIGVDDIKFSIDGDEELHDHIRGKGVFKKVAQVIKNLHEIREREKKKKPCITVNITITPYILGRIETIVNKIKYATANVADAYRLHHIWYVTENELRLHQQKIQEILGVNGPGAKCHLIFPTHIKKYEELADEIKQMSRTSDITCFPDFDYHETRKFYSDKGLIKSRCVAPFFGAIIKPNGDVKFCPDEWIDDFNLGNIKEKPFSDIWNNEKARFFREKIFFHKSFLGCKRCSWMYSF